MLAARNLVKTYAGGARRVEAVRDVSLDVPAGRFLALVGQSGSGKSTLLAMLGGLSRPNQGTVHYKGVDLWALSDDQRAALRGREVGFVFQFANLLPTLRAIDNVALPALLERTHELPAAYRRAEQLLARVGLSERRDAYPAELSGGEQRRVALARALVNSPVLLLADEPTGDLDEATEAAILDLLLEVKNESTTLVLVTHNLDLARRADQVVQVVAGRAAAIDLGPVVQRTPFPGLAASMPLANDLTPALSAPPAPALGHAAAGWIGTALLWAVPVFLLVLAISHGVGTYQRRVQDQKRAARVQLEQAALFRLKADVADITYGPDETYRLTLYQENRSPQEPIYVMTGPVRAYVQVGLSWQEVPLRPTDSIEGRVIEVTSRRPLDFVLAPMVKDFTELLPGYLHVRIQCPMVVSEQSQPKDELVERVDDYYVYLKPHNADDKKIARLNQFPGKPPLWIPMPPH